MKPTHSKATRHSILAAALFSLLILPPQRAEAHSGGGNIFSLLLVSPLYWQESGFTKVPSFVGGALALLPACAAAGTSALLGYGLGLPFGQEQRSAATTGVVVGLGTVGMASTLTGAPFYLVEKVFYDLPTAVIKDSDRPQEVIEQRSMLDYE